jgi:glycosyltransferase involved in cell wall biosynthesis
MGKSQGLPCVVTTNVGGLERIAPSGVEVRSYPARVFPSALLRNLRLYWSARQSDHLVINFDLWDVACLTLLSTLLPGKPCRLTTLDLFVGDPRGRKLQLTRWCLRHVDRLLVYFRDTVPFQELLDLPASKFHYIPFKINGIELIREMTPTDEGFIFCGGRSRRDFRTLFEAVRDLPWPVKVVTSEEAAMNPHASTMTDLIVPPNVEILRRDSDQRFFLDCMSRARLVVLPLVKGTLTQAGIGVYIQSMALRKCVIVSRGVGVSDVLTDQAFMVTPGDSAELRSAIVRLWSDDTLRAVYAERGYNYATPLGGEDQLYRSILAALPD